MIKRVCDICNQSAPNINIEYRVNATRVKKVLGTPIDVGHVDICDKCLKKIIKAKEAV